MQPLRCKFNVVGVAGSDDDVGGWVDQAERSDECETTVGEGVCKPGWEDDSFDDRSNISAHRPSGH